VLTRAERRALQAAQSSEPTPVVPETQPVVTFEEVLASVTEQNATEGETASKLTPSGIVHQVLNPTPAAPAHLSARASRRAQARNAVVCSVAAVAATVAVSTMTASPSGAVEAEYQPEPMVIAAHPITADTFIGDVVASRDAAASRASSRVDLSEVLGEEFDLADPDTITAAADALTSAELLLISERRATPELTDEIQLATDDLRGALDLLQAVSNGDYERALEVLEALAVLDDAVDAQIAAAAAAGEETAATDEPVAAIASFAAPLSAEPADVDDANLEAPLGRSVPEPEVLLDDEFADAMVDIATEIIVSATERVDTAISELELPIPVMEPRALTVAEQIAALAAEAQADGARLHEEYAYAFSGFSNGRIPTDMLQTLSFAPNHMLRPDAATQLERLNEAFKAEFGFDMTINSSYRSFAGQVQARARSGMWAATPGTSNHGWAIAVDFSGQAGGIGRFGTAQHNWMRENAPKFGWIHPEWAQRGGSLPEPWHWEFWGTPDPETGETPTPGVIRGHENATPAS